MEVVYTWVDDSIPGYMEELKKYSANRHDLNPNRTRDNLDLLKYSLRSIEMHAPWVDKITIVSKRPQIPTWLNEPREGLRIVHHDEFIPGKYLPTFSSFSILSHLHLIQELPKQFLYLEDDMLFGRDIKPDTFFFEDGRIRVFKRFGKTPPPSTRLDENDSPWNRALGLCNHLLNEKYGTQRRCSANHVPLVVDKEIWNSMRHEWPGYFEKTARSKYRSTGNVAPEYLYQYYLVGEKRGALTSFVETYMASSYLGLGNNAFLNAVGLRMLNLSRRPLITLNDNFDDSPKPSVVSATKKFLEKNYPTPSRFEKPNKE